jgi:SEC-C motif-containing protein
MRSRYTAFTQANEAYLRATWLPERTPKTIHLDASDKWLGLTVMSTAMLSSEEGTVHFVARVRAAGRAHRIEENSRFVLRDGQWLYVGAVSAA